MPRGGPRPGAGAPLGNLNALKHGRHSPHFNHLLIVLSQLPEVRAILLALHRREQRKLRRARNVARTLFTRLLLQLPPQADPQLNQTIHDLLRRLRHAGLLETPQNNQSPQQNNQPPSPSL